MASSSAPSPGRQRNALIPGVIAATALVAGIPLIASEFAIIICFIVAILALIVAWFAAQAKQWWWTVVMVAIAVLWNPVYPFSFSGVFWLVAHIVGAGLFVVAGVLVRTSLEGAPPAHP
jgi:hypothetical protein